MWFLEVRCIADLLLCMTLLADVPPDTPRWHNTRAQCDMALIELAQRWRPQAGAWTFNCVEAR